jgi:aryl-alcohol dehydrogenase-like predicted oxidoreductase
VADAAWTAQTAHSTAFVSAQNEYSLLERKADAELVPACLRFGVGLLPYFPLANGLLTGKYRRDETPRGSRLSFEQFAPYLARAPWEVIEKLQAYADERSRSILEVAIGGLAGMPAVASVIAGATTPEQVRANAAAGAWIPTPDDLAQLDALTRRR